VETEIEGNQMVQTTGNDHALIMPEEESAMNIKEAGGTNKI